MLIGDKYKIESDELNVMLLEKQIATDKATKMQAGDEYWKIVGYYSSPENALADMANREVRQTGLIEFQKVVSKQDELCSLIRNLKYSDLPHLKTATSRQRGQ